MGVPQVVGFRPDRRHAGFLRATLGRDGAHAPVRLADGGERAGEAAERVDQLAMHRRLDHRAVVVLAVDLDETAAERAQNLRAHRLVVDEGAGPAIRHLDAAKDEIAVYIDVVRAGGGA